MEWAVEVFRLFVSLRFVSNICYITINSSAELHASPQLTTAVRHNFCVHPTSKKVLPGPLVENKVRGHYYIILFWQPRERTNVSVPVESAVAFPTCAGIPPGLCEAFQNKLSSTVGLCRVFRTATLEDNCIKLAICDLFFLPCRDAKSTCCWTNVGRGWMGVKELHHKPD